MAEKIPARNKSSGKHLAGKRPAGKKPNGEKSTWKRPAGKRNSIFNGEINDEL